MIRPTSLRTRLFAAIVLIVVLSVGLALVIGAILTRREVERTTTRNLSRQADLLSQRERASLLPLSRRSLASLRPVLEAQGERAEVAELRKPSPFLGPEAQAELRAGRPVQGRIELDGTEYFYAARGVARKGFVLLRPTSLSAQTARPYVQGLAGAALIGVALAAIASLLLARAVSRPVQRVAEASRDLADQRSPRPVPEEGARELAMLATSFNEMAVQLGKAREAEKEFLLSVSHELKTPLTAIRGYAEGLAEGAVSVDEAAEVIAVEAARLERLVRDLLDLARMNKSEFSVHREPIDLARVARAAVQRYESQARSFGVELELEADAPAPAIGDADRTLQVVSNLVENALRLTPPEGSVRVRAEAGTIAVEDTGPGLRPDELPRAFERFFLHSRYGRERAVGTGLGLAIVKELTEGMGGSVEVTSEPGRCTRFVVRLPRGPAEPALPEPELEPEPASRG